MAATPRLGPWFETRRIRDAPYREDLCWSSGPLSFLVSPPCLLLWIVVHRLEPHAVRIVEEHRVILIVPVIAARWIGDRQSFFLQKHAQRTNRLAALQLECIVMKADVALAVLALAARAVGLRDPEQRLAVAPAGEITQLVFQLEAEKAEHL